MSPLKKGTKLTDNPKDTMIRVRMSKDVVEKMEYVAENCGMNKSEVIRKGIEEQYQKIKK